MLKQAHPVLMVVALSALGLTSGCLTGNVAAGHQAKDDMVDSVKDTREELVLARERIQKTIVAYDELVRYEIIDPRVAFERWAESIERSRLSIEALLGRIEVMNTSSEDYFAGWESEFDAFENSTFKRRSQDRLELVRDRFGEVQQSVEPAQEDGELFLSELHDQMLFLKFDLSSETVAVLSEDANSLQEDGKKLLHMLDSAVQVTDGFVASMEIAGGKSGEPANASPAQRPDGETLPTDSDDEAGILEWPDEEESDGWEEDGPDAETPVGQPIKPPGGSSDAKGDPDKK